MIKNCIYIFLIFCALYNNRAAAFISESSILKFSHPVKKHIKKTKPAITDTLKILTDTIPTKPVSQIKSESNKILNEETAFKWEIKLLGFLFLMITILAFAFFLRKNRIVKNNLNNSSNSIFINLKSARLLLFFGTLIIPIAALSFSVIHKDYDIKLKLSFILGAITFVAVAFTYLSRKSREHISLILMCVYGSVVCYYMFLVYYSSLHPFFILAQIISISLGTVLFDKTKHHLFFSLAVTFISLIISIAVNQPAFSNILYLLAIVCILFVSIISTYIRLSLSDKLIFADTVINDGSSLVMAANETGDVIYINKTFTKVLGFTEEDALGKGWWKVRKVISNDNNPYDKIKRGEIESTATVLLETKNKSHRWIQWNNTKLSNGVFVGIGTDITERREYEQRFRQLVETANDIIYTTDEKGKINYINEVGTRFTGFSKEELMSQSYMMLVDEVYKNKVADFYKLQIKNKSAESYFEFPCKTKSGKILWVGQSVLNKFSEVTGEFTSAQVICRDITERVFVEQKLKQHNADLNVINQVKEIILGANDAATMYRDILKLLGANSDKSSFFSLGIFSMNSNTLKTIFLDTYDKNITENSFPVKAAHVNFVAENKTFILNVSSNNEAIKIYSELQQPFGKYKSAVLMPIVNSKKTYGFVGFFSLAENVYQMDHYNLVKDICTSLAGFFVQYEQLQIIEETNRRIQNYSEQLEILNESKALLITYNNLNDLYYGMIGLLYDKIQNIYRVSILVHELDKGLGTLFFRDEESKEIGSKIILTKDVPNIPHHLKGRIYEKQNFEAEELSNEDKFWQAKDVKSIISLPIMINRNLFASVNLLSKIPNNFTDRQKLIICEINESAATVIEQIQFKDIISQKNKDISDNINYAKRIQSALMPSEDLLNKLLPESFLIFSQRDSLGGDFYWFEQRDDNIFIAAGDCTGHGISGSLLTILASDYIKQAVEVKNLIDPGLILEYLNESLQGTLNKYSEEDEILDGLDISFGVYNIKTNLFLFASAMHNFYLARNNELIEYKGNRKPIGRVNEMSAQDLNFTTHVITLEKNDVVYFTTDGYTDQFHFKTEKRFTRIRLKQLLLQINDKSVKEQKEILLAEHHKWRGDLSQTDDICFIGFKI